MTSQIENTDAYKALEGFKQKLVIKRDNRKQIENAIIIARTIGYGKWAVSSPMSASWKSIVREIVEVCLQRCESCQIEFEIETMTTDSDSNWFCPECWAELAPVMQKEYEELLAAGEIEEMD